MCAGGDGCEGQARRRVRVWLKSQAQVVAAVTDAQGGYALPGTLRHGMYELAAGKDKDRQPRFREQVVWQGKTLERDFDFRNATTKDREPPPVPKGKLPYFDLKKVEAQLGQEPRRECAG